MLQCCSDVAAPTPGGGCRTCSSENSSSSEPHTLKPPPLRRYIFTTRMLRLPSSRASMPVRFLEFEKVREGGGLESVNGLSFALVVDGLPRRRFIWHWGRSRDLFAT